MNTTHMEAYKNVVKDCAELRVTKVTRDREPGAFVALYGTANNATILLATLRNDLGRAK